MKLNHFRTAVLLLGLLILGSALVVMLNQTVKRQVPPSVMSDTDKQAPFSLTSPVLTSQKTIPDIHTCAGEDIAPPLNIQNPPADTESFAIIAHDSNQNDSDKVHWIIWNIPAQTHLITANTIPPKAVQGTTDNQKVGYAGPCLTDGTDTTNYTFDLYALNDTLKLDSGTTRDALVAAMNGKVIDKTTLTVTSQAKKP